MTGILDPRTKIILLILGALHIGLDLALTGEIVVILIFILPFLLQDYINWVFYLL